MDESLGRRLGLRRAEPEIASASPPPPYAGTNLYASDPVVAACLDSTLDEEAEETLMALGAYWGSAEAEEVARIAAASPPRHRLRDAEGRPLGGVDLHPAFHALVNRSLVSGLAAAAWEEGEDRRQHRLRAANLYLAAHCERGHLLSVSATHAAVAALAYAPELEAELFPHIASRRYDRRALPVAEKDGLLMALAVAEPRVGGDRGVTMRAEVSGEGLSVTGEKGFVACPMADVLMVLTRTIDGPTAALVPRYGQPREGAVTITELHEVDGLKSAPIARVVFQDAAARLVGEPGRGEKVLRDVRTLLQLDTALMVAGAARAAVARAVHHARYHASSSHPLIGHGLHARVLADMALESAALTALAMRGATAFDQAFDSDGDHAIARLVTPAARLYAAKSAPLIAAEACECLGAHAFLTPHPAARIRADVQALAQWDGTANDAALECARLVERDPAVMRDALEELSADLGEANTDLVDDVSELGARAADDPSLARAFAEQLGMLAAASAMRRSLPLTVADAYVTTRLRERHRVGFGSLDSRFDAPALLAAIVPED